MPNNVQNSGSALKALPAQDRRMNKEISFVIPCCNEVGNVRAIYGTIQQVFSAEHISFECIMIDDGSSDGTGEALVKMYQEVPEGLLTVIRFSRNFGKEAAIYAGLQHAAGNYVCVIDADMQQRPEVALSMYQKLRECPEYDSVCAYVESRDEGKRLNFFKSTFYKLVNRLGETSFVNGASDFRMISRRMADAILTMPEYFRFSKGIFSWVGFETYYLPYKPEERNSGVSKWSFLKLFRYAVEGIIGYSVSPLRLASVLGLVFTFASVILFLVLIISGIAGSEVSSAALVIGFILFTGGIIMLLLGIMGEYLARTYIQGKHRPVFIIKELLEGNKNG